MVPPWLVELSPALLFSHFLHPHCLQPSSHFFSLQPRPFPFPSSQRGCLGSQGGQHAPFGQALMWGLHDASCQGQQHPWVQAIMGCSEKDNTKAALQKVPCVKCPCWSSVQSRLVEVESWTCLAGKFAIEPTPGLGTHSEGLAKIPDLSSTNS